MTCCSEKICVGGRTYDANFIKRPDGSIVSGTYVDENFNLQSVPQGGFTFGECSNANLRHTATLNGIALSSGNTTITHSLGLPSPFTAMVMAIDPVTNETELMRVLQGSYTTNSLIVQNTVARTANIFVVGLDN
jgi:hypothetical protein